MTKSARGLFRATGKKSKPVHVRNLLGEIVTADALEREKSDFYPTPAEPTRAFLSAELERLKEFPSIWEAASGDGAITRELKAVGLNVFSSDIVDRGMGATIKSFYDYRKGNAPSKAMLDNPPFDQCGWGNGKAAWQYHALEELEVEYMALLLPWPFPGAGGLKHFWEKHKPARVYLMRWKIDFTGQGAPPMLNAWFVWDKATFTGETFLRMLDKGDDARQAGFL